MKFAPIAAAFLALLTTASAASALDVVVTIKPVHSIAAAVMRGVGEPRLLVPGDVSEHTFALAPSQARALAQADLFVRVGPQIEPFTDRLIATLPRGVVVETIVEWPGLVLWPARVGGGFEAHDHGHGHDHHHGHRDDRQGQVGDVSNVDGHVWLDPRNGAAIARHLARRLGELAPAHAGDFKANAERFALSLDDVGAEIAARLAPVEGRAFVTFHDAFQYFERRFGVLSSGAITLSPDMQPGARRLSQLKRRIREAGSACVFAEPQHGAGLVATIVEGTGAKVGTLDPIGAQIAPGPGAYVEVLRGIAGEMGRCLEPKR
ncbi:MAG: zinc ABC transporter substrate-binding protein [Hyphomicrobiaceae bacterium]|nr:zinc ABC transporter substrate-binding protein [Hyphomicrobiaceae bacterium]